MADSIVGDIAQNVGSVAGEVLPPVGDSVSAALGGVQDALQHMELDVTALSGLNQHEHDQVMEAIHDIAPATQDELNHLVEQAQEADAHRVQAEELQHEQSQAAERGDFDHAHELAGNAAYELTAAADHGAAVDHPLVEAQKETAALDNADWHQAIAHEAAHDAGTYAATGDTSHADAYADVAGSHASTAADYGHAGDHEASTVAHEAPAADTSHDASAASE